MFMQPSNDYEKNKTDCVIGVVIVIYKQAERVVFQLEMMGSPNDLIYDLVAVSRMFDDWSNGSGLYTESKSISFTIYEIHFDFLIDPFVLLKMDSFWSYLVDQPITTKCDEYPVESLVKGI
ncbi:hypothetical protein RF11_04376 [Thelohanellus kitauei]|uniref:Uncharacterized protein n=1 Tax=Thelohanellus kitauei TaxID=669202 RepID=A0A0C2IK23_THEKT|nr:hypothetical protein RF11_04376 [Thelohanellus kitauei]